MVLSEAPLLLGRVCRRWRDVAYDTPHLWATLHIGHIPHPTNALLEAEFGTQEFPIPSRVRCHLHAVLWWLNRSGTCPLSLSIHSSRDTIGFHLYLQVLLSFSHRWLDIEVHAGHEPASLALDILASTSPDAFPILRELYLTFPSEKDETPLSQWNTHGGILCGKELRSIGINYFPFNLANMEIVLESRTNVQTRREHRLAGTTFCLSQFQILYFTYDLLRNHCVILSSLLHDCARGHR
jgi:hypothetical protein